MDKIALFICLGISFAPIIGLAAGSDDKQAQWQEKQAHWQEQKTERAFSSLRKTLVTLEVYRKQAIPQVPLRGEVRTVAPRGLKLIASRLHILQNTDLPQPQKQEIEQFRLRYEALKTFFQEKQDETPSPAHHHIRFLHSELYMLEQPDYTSSKFLLDRRLSIIQSLGYRAARIREQDPDYQLTPLLERMEPLAKEYVIAKQRLLEIQPGYRELGRAMTYLHSAESLIGSQAPPRHELLNTNVKKAATYAAAAKKLAPDYFNPTRMEKRLAWVLKYTKQDNGSGTAAQNAPADTGAKSASPNT
ncbi:hypothetical protein FKG94_03580 [Exilibacterium tricleocarpae]|uniref:Uncharacterized protein n=1 Tax=Exilibacterium tricleocarpae TaxID=2591008 RepID=A0A545U569_9GAMM|nr:hypothetical protein [Exilibacterium tricleocarpae]TQV84615.1 hypothetical protein FKG94_03580 [Exilibacterium tricleocarpae]